MPWENSRIKASIVFLIATAVAPFASLAIASADCSGDLTEHLNLAMVAYKQWAAHNKPINSYGDAEWGHFEDELNWVRDHGNMPNCNDDAFETPYYLYSARADRFVIMADAKRPTVGLRLGPGGRPDYNYVLNMRLDRYYSDVGMLYYLGYAKANPAEYAEFKQELMHWFAKMHRGFKPWENTMPYSALSKGKHRSCAMPDRPATGYQMQPAYPEPVQAAWTGPVTVEVTVLVGPAGNVESLSVSRSSGNLLIDAAAIQAARKSSYAPSIKNCRPIAGSYTFRAVF